MQQRLVEVNRIFDPMVFLTESASESPHGQMIIFHEPWNIQFMHGHIFFFYGRRFGIRGSYNMQRGVRFTLYSIMDSLHQISEGGHLLSKIRGSKPAINR